MGDAVSAQIGAHNVVKVVDFGFAEKRSGPPGTLTKSTPKGSPVPHHIFSLNIAIRRCDRHAPSAHLSATALDGARGDAEFRHERALGCVQVRNSPSLRAHWCLWHLPPPHRACSWGLIVWQLLTREREPYSHYNTEPYEEGLRRLRENVALGTERPPIPDWFSLYFAFCYTHTHTHTHTPRTLHTP